MEPSACSSTEQLVVLEALSRAVSHQELATTLDIALAEVPVRISRAVDLMGATNEIHAVVTAIRRGLI